MLHAVFRARVPARYQVATAFFGGLLLLGAWAWCAQDLFKSQGKNSVWARGD